MPGQPRARASSNPTLSVYAILARPRSTNHRAPRVACHRIHTINITTRWVEGGTRQVPLRTRFVEATSSRISNSRNRKPRASSRHTPATLVHPVPDQGSSSRSNNNNKGVTRQGAIRPLLRAVSITADPTHHPLLKVRRVQLLRRLHRTLGVRSICRNRKRRLCGSSRCARRT
ncbi:hypothetical protein VTG60DRAFT_2532 [Thermothelomyces hinnuleus]